MNTTSNQAKSYFDLHTSGIGFLQRAREVHVEDADPYLSVTVAALVGPKADPVYRYFDVRVSGAEAQELVSKYIGVDDPKRRPLVRFRIGDSWPDAYIRPRGERKGEVAASLKGRLLKAEMIDRVELAKIEQHELITRGIGYLSRPIEVKRNEGEPFVACTIAALTGKVDAKKRRYRYFDTVVTTEDAQDLVRQYAQAVEADRKVLIAFRLNDMTADPYIRTKGEKAGQPAASLKSTLVHIGLIKVDGQQVYPAAPAEAETPPAQVATAPESDGSADNVVSVQKPEPAEREPEVTAEELEPAMAASF